MFLSRKSARPWWARSRWLASMGPGCFYPGNLKAAITMNLLNRASIGKGCFYPGNSKILPDPTKPGWLQWGRDVSIPEIRAPVVHHPLRALQLQWGRDVSIPEISKDDSRRVRRDGFNGAGMFLSRKYKLCSRPIYHPWASMGPGCFYPGNKVENAIPRSNGMLQWGRDVSIPEICMDDRNNNRVTRASMGPGCFYPGNGTG